MIFLMSCSLMSHRVHWRTCSFYKHAYSVSLSSARLDAHTSIVSASPTLSETKPHFDMLGDLPSFFHSHSCVTQHIDFISQELHS